jgi:hypothetical protein
LTGFGPWYGKSASVLRHCWLSGNAVHRFFYCSAMMPKNWPGVSFWRLCSCANVRVLAAQFHG